MDVNGPQPTGWSIAGVDDIRAASDGAVASGPFGSSIGARFFQSTGVPLIRGSNLAADAHTRLVDRDFVYVSREKAAEFGRALAAEGDLIFTCWGTISQVGLIDSAARYPQYLISNKQMKLSPNRRKASSEFLFYLFSGRAVQAEISSRSIGTSVPGFNLGRLRSLRFALPPLPEQEQIATVLSDLDRLLAAADELLAKKRQIKQGAMQELLTGKRRLPGFSHSWVRRRLGDLGSWLKGAGVTRAEAVSGSIPCVRYGEIYTHHHERVRSFLSYVSATVASIATRICSGDILFAGSGETKEEIGKAVAFLGDGEACAGGDIVILRPEGVDSLFLGYLLNAPAVARQKASKGQGDAVVHISAAALATIEVDLPEEREEQSAIASVLSDLDAEIAALEAKLAKLRLLKRAMMEELLTGRIRLVPPSQPSAAAAPAAVDQPAPPALDLVQST